MNNQPNIFQDIDFVIPIFIDHNDRLRNLKIAIKYLQKLGCNNIFVNEYYREDAKASNIVPGYISTNISGCEYYNKMTCGNELYDKFCNSNIVCLYDADVLTAKKDLADCYNKLVFSDYDFAYPYNGKFYDIPENLVENLNSDLTTPIDINACTFFAPASHGGCVMFKRNVFEQGGKLNPNFKNVGYDDDEINIRFQKIGFKKYRSSSPLLHMTHFRGNTTYNHSKFVEHNAQECGKVSNMSVEHLRDYIKCWHVNS
jgi:hypothetical protein